MAVKTFLSQVFFLPFDKGMAFEVWKFIVRAVLQRVSQARVKLEGRPVASISQGLVVLLGVAQQDTEKDAQYLAAKIAELRVFEDKEGKMNLSAKEIQGEILVVSQFTLYGDCRKGRRPSFTQAAPADVAEQLYLKVVQELREQKLKVETGVFQAAMELELVNDGPVTLLLDSQRLF